MDFNYQRRQWLLFLLLFSLVSLSSAQPLFFNRGPMMYAFSRGLYNYRLEGIPLELVYAEASPVIFHNILYQALPGEEGIEFYFPSGSRIIDNSLVGVEASGRYENYFFFLNKKKVSFLGDYYTHLSVDDGYWKGKNYLARYEAGAQKLFFFISDHDLIGESEEKEYVYSLIRGETEIGPVTVHGKREYIKKTDDTSLALYEGGLAWKGFSCSGAIIPEEELFRIGAEYKGRVGGTDVWMNPFIRDDLLDVNMSLKRGALYMVKRARQDWIGPYEADYYEAGLSAGTAGHLFLRYADRLSHPLYDYDNAFIPGAAYNIPVRAGEHLMLIAEGDLLFTKEQKSVLRNYIYSEFSFFQGDLTVKGYLRNTILTPSEESDGSFYTDLFLSLALVNTEVDVTVENIFGQDLAEEEGAEGEGPEVSFHLRWFFYN